MKYTYKYIGLTFLLSLLVYTAQAQVEDCYNGIDDDGDGLADCADPDAFCEDFRDCNIETDCGNGVDDDGDGFFDYYDGDCLNDPDNPNDYITIKPDCEAVPVGNVFEIESAWDSDIQTSAALGMPSVADLDLDGYPEVITMNSQNGWLYILDGRNGNTLDQVRVRNGEVFAYPAVADVDGDGFGEIFTIDQTGVIRVFEHNLTLKWSATSVFTGFGRPLGLADFNQDGRAELYYVNEIRDAATGALLVKGSHGSTMYPSANDWQNHLNAVPVAINMLPSPGLELVVGHIIYTVNITNTAGTAGNSLVEARNMNNATTKPAGYNGYYPADADYGNQTFSQTAVVDYNLDGSLDIIIGGANGGIDGPTTAFFWDLANDLVKTFTVLRPGNTIPANIIGTFEDTGGGNCNSGDQCYWERGLGNINIANIDDDPQLEATFMSGSSLYALDDNWNLEWANHEDFWESSSGVTGTTVFDFDGDGSSEIVYRDEIDLYIVDGITGKPLNNQISGTFCSSQTQADYPIVADVDGDGETEIIISCGQATNEFGESPATSGTRTNGFIRAYKAAGSNYWVPSRALWNQTNYFNVNINDNLTVPRYQQSHHLDFAQICNDPNAPTSFSLNKFLNQSPRISYCGQLTFPSPKLDFDSAGGVFITPPVCPDNQFEVRVVFQNNGSQAISKPVPISFYGANPTNSYSDTDESPYLETVYIDVPGGIQINQKVDTTFMVNALRGAFTLFVSLNDIGQNDSTGAPMTNAAFYPLTKLNGTIRECDDTPTIVNEAVDPLPFEVKAVKIRDNRNCPGGVSFNNGEIEVLRPDDTPFPASSYSFEWTNISTGQVIGTDALVMGLDSGTYRVEVMYNAGNGSVICTGTADTVTVLRNEEWPDTQVVTLEEIQPVSSCKPGTADGIARVLINGAAIDETEYDIIWSDEQQPDTVAIGSLATNLKPIRYKVTVTNLLTGCPETQTIDMTLDLPELDPNPTVTKNTNCKNPNGSITAQLLSGNIADYDFMLIQLSPAPQDTLYSNNPSFGDLAAGIYELRAYNPTTDCGRYSAGVEVEIVDQKAIDNLTVEIVKKQTACEAPYNGQLRAVIANANQYSFVWYLGTVTTGSTAVVVGNAALTPDTLSTNLTDGIYTVVVTHQSSGCSTSEQIQLEEDIEYPDPDISNFTITNQTTCDPNGSIQAAIANANPGDTFIYTLLEGSTELASNSNGLFEDLEAGNYIVMVENTATGCISNPSDIVKVEDNIPAFPAYTITDVPVTNCNAASPNGSLTLNFSGGNDDYDFYWYVGVDTSTPVSPQPSVPNSLTNIAAGDYKVRVTSDLTGCETLISLELGDISAEYQDQITATVSRDQEYCFTNEFSGEIEASLIQSTSGGVPDTSDYIFYWYEGRKNDLRNGTVITPISGENNATIKGLNVGWYSVRAVKTDGSGCHALDTAEVRVLDERDFPITNINVNVVDQSSCNSNDPNGSLVGNVAGDTTGYSFTWYQLIGGIKTTITTNNPGADINVNSVDSLGVGTYVLVVENRATGCTGETQVYLKDNIIKGSEIRLNLDSEEATLCTPPNGIAEVTSIDLSEDDGATFTLTDALTNYTYQWYHGEDTTTPVDPIANPTATTARLENVEPGMYTVVANNVNSECTSVSYSVEVGSEIQNQLDFDFIETTQSDCINPDGGLQVDNITGGTGPFLYQWYKGGDDTYPLTSETSAVLSNIRADKYMVRITDQATGCYKDSVYVLPPDAGITPVPPATLSTVNHVNTCNPSNYNGRLVAEVDSTVLSLPNFSSHDPSNPNGDFFYYWFKGKNPQYKDANASPIDDISNFDVLNNDPPVIGDNKAEIIGLEPGFYTVIVVDAKDYIASGGIAPLGCRSDPRTFEVQSLAQSPIVEFTTQPDSYCIGDNGSATLTIGKRDTDATIFSGFVISDATKNGGPLTGTEVISMPIDDAVNRQTSISITNLDAASYTFTLFDNTTECDTTIALDISINADYPTLTHNHVQLINHKTSCNPINGSAQVVALAGSDITDLADFTFYWHDEIPTVSADIIANAIHTGEIATGLDVGTYYVFAINNETGCPSSHRSIEIKDEEPSTIIEIVSSSPDRNCDPTVGSGSINIRIYDEDVDGNVLYPTGGYTITWEDENGIDISAQATTDGGTQPATSVLPNLLAGVYTISVINNDTQCGTVIARDTIKYEPYIPAFTASSAQITHSTTCDGNGTIAISQIMENGTVILSTAPAFMNYSFEWRYDDDATVVEDGSGNPITANTITDLLPGTYYVYVSNTSTGNCQSNRLQIVIEDKSTLPLIYQQEIVHFISCTGINEGIIEVFGGEFVPANIPALGYQYAWTMADGSPMPAYTVYNADNSRVSNLTPGTYRVTMTNLSTGCSRSAEYTINERVFIPVLTVTKITDQTYCYGNGEAEVSSVTLRGNALNLSDFQYHWYENDLSTEITSPLYGLSLDSLAADSLIAGTYFVKAVNPTGCETLPVQFVIEDLSEPLVVVLDDISGPILACDPSNFPEGEIEVEVRNSSSVITSWYAGNTITDPADSIVGFNNSLEIENLVPGAYTVWVQDTLTGCSTTRTYTIEGIEVPVVVSTSAKNFSSCIQPDGMIAANINGGSGDYIITWYSGSGTNLQQISSANNSTSIEGLTNGTYTVVVQDRLEPYCQESKAEIVIEDSRGKEIMVNVNNDFQMTNCDESVPNGQLSVAVSGELSRYNFFWYNGTDTNGKPIATGPVIAKLVPGDYTVLARDKVTGCISRAFTGEVIAIPDTTIIPAPIVSTTPVTRCDAPNGTATAVLDSTFVDPDVDYEYTWYNEEGEVVFSSSRSNTANFLAAGDYTVVVTNVLSGCSSESANFSIGEEIYIPEFEIISTPSTCLEANGSVRLEFVEPIKIIDIEWITPDGFATGFYLTNQPAGIYEVTITDDKGCKHTKTAEIKSNIHVYNGVSPNGDGKNDRFIISCIEQYNENVVRIYNRTGAIVYENFKYDNDRIYFEGYGNRGLYIGGEKLPEGTYYYIVDKKNGEAPVSGYLELLR